MVASPQRDCVSGEKRPMEVDGGDGGEVKRRRKDEDTVVNGREEEEMKRVAELVLVLSAMGRMRGGRDPTVVEAEMMAEARKKVVALCEELSPNDVVPKEVFGVVIDDLGLNRLKDQRLGFRPPKLSLSEKIALSKRRMEESKAFAVQPAPCSSQRVQTGSGSGGEARATQAPVRMFPVDKAGQPVSISAVTSQLPTSVAQPPVVQHPVVHAPIAASMPLPSHLPSTVARPPLASASMPNSTGRDSTSVAHPRVDKAHLRPDGRFNGPSSIPHVPVSSAADRHTVRSTPVQLQPQPASRVIVAAMNKAPDQLPVRTGTTSSSKLSAQPVVVQTPKTVVNQTAAGVIPMMHHPVQNLQFSHPPIVNHHLEISKIVYRLLNPKLPQRPAWTPPSRDYMSKEQPCQFCKLIINEVDNVVVCDACEKAFHLGCLQSHNAKGIPRGEWHCPRCLTMSHGKPFPPKYGRVTRNMNAPKGPSTASIAQFPSDSKMESFNEKVAQPNTTTNGVRTKSQFVKAPEPSPGSNLPRESDSGRIGMSVGIKKEDEPNLGPGLNRIKGAAVDASISTSIGSSSDKPYQQVMKSEVSYSEDGSVSETECSTPGFTQVNSASGNMQTARNASDIDLKVSNGAENPLLHDYRNGVTESNQNHDKEKCDNNAAQENLAIIDGCQELAEEMVKTSESSLHIVDWIGDADKVVDMKKFYHSCRINGVVYQLQDYALFRSSNGKLTPFRLQGMWEDSESKLKWLLVHQCYSPDDLPQEAGHPGAPQSNEVYESVHDSKMMAGFVQGPCEVLPFRKFGEELERSIQSSQANDRPVFIRNWFYDELKRAFRPSAS